MFSNRDTWAGAVEYLHRLQNFGSLVDDTQRLSIWPPAIGVRAVLLPNYFKALKIFFSTRIMREGDNF